MSTFTGPVQRASSAFILRFTAAGRSGISADIKSTGGSGMAQMAALSVEAKSMAVKKFRAALHIAVFSFIRQAS